MPEFILAANKLVFTLVNENELAPLTICENGIVNRSIKNPLFPDKP